MKLISLRLKGFKGLRAGIGLEDIFLDFTKLPEHGLIAIVGGNGMGKTTILDNCHPYRLMPFKVRKSKEIFSPTAFCFYDECYGSDAIKELVFAMESQKYRSLILIDADRRKQESYLYREENGDWQPLNDGKTRTYDIEVEKVMGSPTLFFTSCFRSQGAKNLSDYSRGDIMGIIAELLCIDKIKLQSEKARKVADELKTRVASIANQRDIILQELEQEQDIRAQIQDVNDRRDVMNATVTEYKERISEIRMKISETQQQQAALDSERKRLQDLQKLQSQDEADLAGIREEKSQRIAKSAKEKEDAAAWLKQEHAELNRELARLTAELEEKTTSLTAATTDIRVKLERAEKIAANGETIRAKVTEENAKKAEISDLEAEISRLEAVETKCREQAGTLTALREKKSSLERTASTLDYDHDRKQRDAQSALNLAKTTAAKLDEYACHGSFPTCRAIADAVEAKEQIPVLEKAYAEASAPCPALLETKETVTALESKVAALAPNEADLQTVTTNIKGQRQKVADIRSELEAIARFTKLLPELEFAAAAIETYRKDLAEKEREVGAIAAATETRRKELSTKIACRTNEHDTRVDAIDQGAAHDLSELAKKEEAIRSRMSLRDLDILTMTEALSVNHASVLETLHAELKTKESRLEEIEGNIRSLHGEEMVLQSRLDGLAKQRTAMKSLESQIDRYNREIAAFVLLAKACSNDGIIALEIDDSGPSISAIANDLLNASYGSRFSVLFATQGMKIDGSMKDDFDIIVFDSDTGESKSITDTSGGQTVWIEDAITRAISLYKVGQSEKRIETLFSDEKDGQLDAEKKQQYFAIKRQMLAVGGHSREFYISQTPELQDMADGQIVLEKGSVSVQ